jgi:hypothetical protein
MVQPKGAVEVMTLVQVGLAEQAVMVVVVPGRGVGRAQRTCLGGSVSFGCALSVGAGLWREGGEGSVQCRSLDRWSLWRGRSRSSLCRRFLCSRLGRRSIWLLG